MLMKSCCKDAFNNEDLNQPHPSPKKQNAFLLWLKDKWKAKSIAQVVLILFTFAIGGSLCGYLGKTIMGSLGIEKGALWLIVYIIVMTIIWPACILGVSIIFGQFRFFKNYILRMASRISGKKKENSEVYQDLNAE